MKSIVSSESISKSVICVQSDKSNATILPANAVVFNIRSVSGNAIELSCEQPVNSFVNDSILLKDNSLNDLIPVPAKIIPSSVIFPFVFCLFLYRHPNFLRITLLQYHLQNEHKIPH